MPKRFVYSVDGEDRFDDECESIVEARKSALQYCEDNYGAESEITIFELVPVQTGKVKIDAEWETMPRGVK